MSERERGRLSEGTLAELRAVDVGLLPEDLFIELARLTVLAGVEVVCLRQGAVGVEVLLTQRVESDQFWAGQWHSPGSIVRPTDAAGSYHSAFARILSGELGLVEWLEPVFVGTYFWHAKRGSAVSLVHWLDVTETTMPVGAFFPVTALPENTIVDMDKIIVMAANAYAAHFKV